MIGGGADGGFTTVLGITVLFLGLIGFMIALSSIGLAFTLGAAAILLTIAAIAISLVVIMKGLAILNSEFANNQCRNYATNILLGGIAVGTAGLTSAIWATLLTSFMGVSTTLTGWLTNRICGV